ncbi:MAG: hypothetical protein QME57_00090 [Patescibacteria group bacterium]|nr:hypothetical protein [Patescibacteria group bacterium]
MLAEISQAAPIDFALKKCHWKKYNRGRVVELLKKLEFHSLIKRLPEAKGQTDKGSIIEEDLKL